MTSFEPKAHAKAGHIITVTSVPMFCVTCDIFLTDDTFEDTKALVKKGEPKK